MARPLEVRYKAKKFRVEELGKRIAELPRLMRRGALIAVAEYMMKKFRLYPRYKYASRAGAYGSTGAKFENGKPVPDGYFSKEQFRLVMAKIANKEITPGKPNRSQDTKRAWRIEGKEARDIRSIALVNDAPAAVFLYHPIYQARQPKNAGWRNLDVMTEENLDGAMQELEDWIDENIDNELDKALTQK